MLLLCARAIFSNRAHSMAPGASRRSEQPGSRNNTRLSSLSKRSLAAAAAAARLTCIRGFCASVKSQKRPAYLAKETYHMERKTYGIAKEPYYPQRTCAARSPPLRWLQRRKLLINLSRGMRKRQKRPTCMTKEAYVYDKRDLRV